MRVKNKIENNAANVKFMRSDILKDVEYKKFNLIVSNPPYIPDYEYEVLEEKVLKYEPKLALTAPENGLYFYEKISKNAPDHLVKGSLRPTDGVKSPIIKWLAKS